MRHAPLSIGLALLPEVGHYEPRVALVIGNSDYSRDLTQSCGCAAANAQVMRRVVEAPLGFEMIDRQDTNLRQMQEDL
jgi:hypothetical protein